MILLSVVTAVVLLGAAGAGRATTPCRDVALLARSSPRPMSRASAATDVPGEPRRRRSTRRPMMRRSSTRPVADAEVAEWCESLARAVRGGASLRTAILDVGAGPTLRPAIEPLAVALGRGDAVADAIASITSRRPANVVDTGFVHALTVIRVAATVGGRLAETLDRTAAASRDRVTIEQERRAHGAPARLSALVLTAMPVLVLAATLMWSASARAAMAGPLGAVCITAGGGLNLLGWWWMRRILRGGR